MGRKPAKTRAEDYGLPPLTIHEAARVLEVDQAVFTIWLVKAVQPSLPQLSMWGKERRPLPEVLIRLYRPKTSPSDGEVCGECAADVR